MKPKSTWKPWKIISSLPKYENQWILNFLDIDLQWIPRKFGINSSTALMLIQWPVARTHPQNLFYRSPVNFQSDDKKQNDHIFSWSVMDLGNDTMIWLTHCRVHYLGLTWDFPTDYVNYLFKNLETLSMVKSLLKLWGCTLFQWCFSFENLCIYFFFQFQWHAYLSKHLTFSSRITENLVVWGLTWNI